MMASQQRIIEASGRPTLGLNWCAQCGREYWTVTAEAAAAIAGVDTLTIYRWAYGGRVHAAEIDHEEVLICLNSL